MTRLETRFARRLWPDTAVRSVELGSIRTAAELWSPGGFAKWSAVCRECPTV